MWLALVLVLVSLGSMLLGVLLVFVWAVPKLENRFLFRPMKEIFKTPADFGIPFEEHFVDTEDGCRLVAWHLCPLRPRASVIYFHGNTGNLGLFNEVFQLLYRSDLQVFAVDYRGYGLSSGTPTEKGIQRDALATVAYFRENLAVSGVPLIYWGRSLGSSVAAFASSRSVPHGLVLETAFASKRAIMNAYSQYRYFYPFSRARLNTAKYLKNHEFPVLVVHGDRDRTVPIEQGRHLYDLLTGPKDFLFIEGADHINIHRHNSRTYIDRVLRFAEEVRPPLVN